MKQTYALLLFICVYSVANAQIKKGDIVLGGNLGYSDQSSTNQTAPMTTIGSRGLNINPSLGKAIKDNLVLGIDISYIHSSYSQSTADTSTDHQTDNGGLLGVFVRRYKPIGAGFSLFGEAELSGNYTHGNNVEPGGSQIFSHSNSYGFTLNLYPGIAYALNRKWQIEISLPSFLSMDYTHSKETQQYTGQTAQTSTNHSFGLSSSLTGNDEFAIGVRYIIGG